jgi:hypothetical protein
VRWATINSTKHSTKTARIPLVLAAGVIALGTLANSHSAAANSLNITVSADANITGSVPYTPPTSNVSLLVNIFSNSRALVDVSLAAVPLNATVSDVQFNFMELSYANAGGLVSISGYPRRGDFTASDASAGSSVGQYSSIAVGLGLHSVPLNSTGVNLVSSLLGTKNHLGLRFASGSNDTNTNFASLADSFYYPPPSVTLSYTLPNNPALAPQFDANLTGSTVNQYDPSAYGIIANTFSSTKGVIDYSLAGIPARALASASFSFQETSTTGSSSAVSLYAYSRSGPITSADAAIAGTLIGSYSPASLGLGNHSVSLNSDGLAIIQSLLGSNQDLGLLVVPTGSTNTQFGSLEQSPGFAAPTLSMTFAWHLGDANLDGHADIADLSTFTTALADLSKYESTRQLSDSQLALIGDFSGDSQVTNTDLQGLITLLANSGGSGSVTAVPEPSSLALLVPCALAFLLCPKQSDAISRASSPPPK